MKKPKEISWKKRLKRTLITLTVLFVLVSLIGGTCVFYIGMGRKAKLPAADATVAASTSVTLKGSKSWMNKLGVERMVLTVRDGVVLTGYYLPAKKPSKKLAVLVHSHGTSAGRMQNYAKMYRADGYHVFAADNRGHGESGGAYMGMGWLDRLDYLEWLELLIPKLGEDCEIVLHGLSMGASAVMMMSGEEALPAQVKCIVEDCGYTSVEDEFCHQINNRAHLPAFPFLLVGNIESKLFAGYAFEEASALEQIKKARVPLFFIHGGADDFVPTAMVHTLYEAAGVEKDLWVVEGAKHAQAYSKQPDEYKRRVKAFCKKYITH